MQTARLLLLVAASTMCHAMVLPTPQRRLTVTDALPSDLEDLTRLTMSVFFGEVGSDWGFNNARAIAFSQLTAEQRESLREKSTRKYSRMEMC